MALTVSQPPPLTHRWNTDDPWSRRIVVPDEDLVADPVTGAIEGSDVEFTFAPSGDSVIVSLAAEVLEPRRYPYRWFWKGREFIAGVLDVRPAGEPGSSTTDPVTVPVTYGDVVIPVTVTAAAGPLSTADLFAIYEGG